ncbi:MAG: hypothetical protein DRI57_19995 [Deltaproteobacteria bacterium]|nr:MAG: hypothetical protein DRI57_19995 [Deltaproteobacteria bacterium]
MILYTYSNCYEHTRPVHKFGSFARNEIQMCIFRLNSNYTVSTDGKSPCFFKKKGRHCQAISPDNELQDCFQDAPTDFSLMSLTQLFLKSVSKSFDKSHCIKYNHNVKKLNGLKV